MNFSRALNNRFVSGHLSFLCFLKCFQGRDIAASLAQSAEPPDKFVIQCLVQGHLNSISLIQKTFPRVRLRLNLQPVRVGV